MATAFESTSLQERFTNGLEHPKKNRYTYKSRTSRNMCFNYHKWIQVIMVDVFSFFAELDYMYLRNMLFWSFKISGGWCEKPPTFLLKWGKPSVWHFGRQHWVRLISTHIESTRPIFIFFPRRWSTPCMI